MKTVYLHIGYFKTGTTALQHFLWHNRDALAEQGVLYPKTGCLEQNGHVHLVSSIFQKHGHKIPVWLEKTFKPEAVWSAVRAEIDASDCQDILLSNEHFCSFCQHDKLEPLIAELGPLLAGYNVKIVAYLRRIDSYLLSWYNQIVKMGKITPPLKQYAESLLGRRDHHLYHGRILDLFSGQYGMKNMTVRLYDRDHLKDSDIVSDFLSLFDLAASEFQQTKETHNPGIRSEFVPLRRVINAGGEACNVGRHYQDNINDVLHHLEFINNDMSKSTVDVDALIDALWPHITDIAVRYCPGYISLYNDRLALQAQYDSVCNVVDKEQQRMFMVSSMSMLLKENQQIKLELLKLRSESEQMIEGMKRQTSQLNELTMLFTRALGSGAPPTRRGVSHLSATGS